MDSLLVRYAAYGFEGAVLVAKDGRVVLVKGPGLADHERQIPNSAGTLFEMNSITIDGSKRGATIEHLATHPARRIRTPGGRPGRAGS